MLLFRFSRRYCAAHIMSPYLAGRRGFHRSDRPTAAVASATPTSALTDIYGLPVMTSSWRAVRSLDKAYAEVSVRREGIATVIFLSLHLCGPFYAVKLLHYMK